MRVLAVIFAVAWLVGSLPVRSAECPPNNRFHDDVVVSLDHPPTAIDPRCGPETDDVGGSIVLDEHLLTNAQNDRDYNGGGEIKFSGDSAFKCGHWLDLPLQWVDDQIGIDRPGSKWQAAHAFAAGLLIFTPRDLSAHEVVQGDRPYASLFFVSSGRRYTNPEVDVAYSSSLTVGVLGLAAAESVQHALHSITGSTQPEGWSHQISDGGEPTARYSLARQALLTQYRQPDWSLDSKWTVAGSVGTITEGSVALSLRCGRIDSPWWAFTPEQNTYVQETQPGPPPPDVHSRWELFMLLGTRFKYRVYNAFLEGQFRSSDLRYSSDSINHALGEAWAGIEYRNSAGIEIRYLARWESPELRSGIGSRTIVWGSLEFAKSL
jgi:Uncharacterized protein conserved in bacteria (DUF2219)